MARTRRRWARASATPISRRNLRYSQLAPLSMFEEKNTATNLPAQIDIYAEGEDAYKFLFVCEGRRLGQQDLPVPGDAVASSPRTA